MGIILKESRDRVYWNIKVSHNGSEVITIRKREVKIIARAGLEKFLRNEDNLEKLRAKLLLEGTDSSSGRQLTTWISVLERSNARKILTLEMINAFVAGWKQAKKFWDQIEINLKKKDPKLLAELLISIKSLFGNFNQLAEADKNKENLTWLFEGVGSEIFFFMHGYQANHTTSKAIVKNEQLVLSPEQL